MNSLSKVQHVALGNGAQSDDWVLAWIVAGVLALPRSHIRTVEQTDTLRPAGADAPETGWFTKPRKPWAAYSFNGELELQARRDAERFTVFLADGEQGIGFNCERLKLLPGETELTEFTPSVCMKNDGPVHALGLLDGAQVLLMSDGPAVVRHLQRMKPEERR